MARQFTTDPTLLFTSIETNDEWHRRLTRDGHLERCISLIDDVLNGPYWAFNFYLIGIFAPIKLSGMGLPFTPAEETWRMLVRRAWDTHYLHLRKVADDYVVALPTPRVSNEAEFAMLG
ncbi:hypothetical protein EV702DRAFT_1277684 [Suillus placidus]|uniref:Uncharacterized protein n=1 Tax=Suillus placidus TaxID=48579 RepID=A0A9P7D4I8_9AGAM|nr:hypothetical protein EV702DRAFT_1277684 [Suillus placidus]